MNWENKLKGIQAIFQHKFLHKYLLITVAAEIVNTAVPDFGLKQNYVDEMSDVAQVVRRLNHKYLVLNLKDFLTENHLFRDALRYTLLYDRRSSRTIIGLGSSSSGLFEFRSECSRSIICIMKCPMSPAHSSSLNLICASFVAASFELCPMPPASSSFNDLIGASFTAAKFEHSLCSMPTTHSPPDLSLIHI